MSLRESYQSSVAGSLSRIIGSRGLESRTDPRTALASIITLVANHKLTADNLAARIREAQHRRNLPMDTRADYAEGSAAAYSMVLSIIAGATGIPREELAIMIDHHA
jgi:hypothetical protein